MSARSAAAVLTVASLCLVGCGSASSDLTTPLSSATSPSPSASSTPLIAKSDAAVRTAVRGYLHDAFSGNATATFADLSHRCQLTLCRQSVIASVGGLKSTYGALKPTSIRVTSLHGDSATVSYKLPVPVLNKSGVSMRYEHGWRLNQC